MKKLKEKLSILMAKKPALMVLLAILLFNVVFFFASAGIISALSLKGTEELNFIEAAYYTLTMILDSGAISNVVTDIGQVGVAITIVCLCVVVIGMISFTGAVIGYITNTISSFIENASEGTRALVMYDHTIILNWNSRASEIINDFLFSHKKEKVVVLVNKNKEAVQREINERIEDTVKREKNPKLKNRVTVIVREGDVYSVKQLQDLSISSAKAVIILDDVFGGETCEFAMKNAPDKTKGNSQTVKTLMQVADLVNDKNSADNQKIIVEICDDWTYALVDEISKYKTVKGKCNIVPVRVNKTLGQILSQFSLMPELNEVYKELLSNKGSAFYSVATEYTDEKTAISEYLKNHRNAIPLTIMDSSEGKHFYFSCTSEGDIEKTCSATSNDYKVSLNSDYVISQKRVVVLGHNSKSRDIMKGFASFCGEWTHDGVLPVEITVIDDKLSLEKMNYYADYPFVKETVCADIYDRKIICDTIERCVVSSEEDTSVLILSDDTAPEREVDANVLASLIYVQEIINRQMIVDPNFDANKIDLIVEIISPKHHDVVSSYSVKNVVISNRYVSKMMAQICEKEALYDFYKDILTYDDEDSGDKASKEIYVKKVGRFFDEVPAKSSATEFIRALYDASIGLDETNPSIAIGYVKKSGEVVIFEGNQDEIVVELTAHDKVILFAEH